MKWNDSKLFSSISFFVKIKIDWQSQSDKTVIKFLEGVINELKIKKQQKNTISAPEM